MNKLLITLCIFRKILKPTKWLETFEKNFNSDGSETMRSFKPSLGKNIGFVFTLDTLNALLFTKQKAFYKNPGVIQSGVWVKVHSHGEIPSLLHDQDRSNWMKIDSLSNDLVTHSVSINVEKLSSTDNFRKLNSNSRGCNFPDEGSSLRLFRHYTRGNCHLECAWRLGEEACGCRPWYVPALDSSRVCFMLEALCFQTVIADILQKDSLNVGCKCPQDCEKIRYSIDLEGIISEERAHYGYPQDIGTWRKSQGSVKFGNNLNLGNYIFDDRNLLLPYEPLIGSKMPSQPIGFSCSGWDDLVSEAHASLDLLYLCAERGPSQSRIDKRESSLITINMYFERHQGYVTSIVKDAKLSLADKISWVGGNLGLLTGFSIVSGMELLYWLIFKILLKSKKVDLANSEPGEVGSNEAAANEGRAQSCAVDVSGSPGAGAVSGNPGADVKDELEAADRKKLVKDHDVEANPTAIGTGREACSDIFDAIFTNSTADSSVQAAKEGGFDDGPSIGSNA